LAVVGLTKVLRVHAALGRAYAARPSSLVRYALVNGLPGFVTLEADGQVQTTGLEIEDGKIVGIYVMRNPDKLRRVSDSPKI
jgi:RNA polymerase sigma-70 factor (ECF subfamily)